MTKQSEKPQPKSRKENAALSHDDDKLPPARAAAQAEREAQLRQFVTGTRVDAIKKGPAS